MQHRFGLISLFWYGISVVVEPQNRKLFELHAEYCRALANPNRLMILDCLREGVEHSVGDIAEMIEAPLSTVSQHLSALKAKSIVESRKEGQTVYYRIVDSRLTEACQTIRAVLLDTMKRRGEIAAREMNQE